jgi:Fur family ferric uptake transcriptional regulator
VSGNVKSLPDGMKRTKQREIVFSVLAEADRPLSAAEICSRTQAEGTPVWLSTVYRILEIFVKEHVAEKIAVTASDMAFYGLSDRSHRHYAVCISCRRIISMDNCPMEQFLPSIQDENFRVTGHNLEIYGYCGDCK